MDATHDSMDHAPHAASPSDSVGSMLRKRRVALGMSQSDVAAYVKLPPRRIEALEQERWDELPDGPYLRGFLKNVARALSLDAAALIDRVDESLMQSRNPDSILVAPGSTHATLPRRSGPADDRRSGRSLVFGALVFAIIAALIAWSGTDSFDQAMHLGKMLVAGRQAATTDATPAAPRNDAVTSPMVAPSKTIAAPQVFDSAAAPKPTTDPAVASTTPPALRLQFSEESWVEVRSADGRVLLSRLNAAGTEQSLEGDAPFSLVVGNAKGVDLSFRGQHVDLAPYTRDQVARLTLS